VDAKALEVRLHAYSRFVGTVYFDDLTVQVIGNTTGIAGTKTGLPTTYELEPNYPNPFNPTTTISYGVPQPGRVRLTIFNMLGQQIRSLIDMDRAAGRFTATWDGRDDAGIAVGSGVYFYRLVAGEAMMVRKMMMLK
jgi:flagellar hook assembly protein FlgD